MFVTLFVAKIPKKSNNAKKIIKFFFGKLNKVKYLSKKDRSGCL